ncbi:MAG: serine/threonine protein kinase [Caldilineaceae bacterium]|nr:serine/threonine protein kinase [Caldilineaceae bacterium]
MSLDFQADQRLPQEPPLRRLGTYEIEGVLGQGAAATVYRARRTDGVAVAFKVLHRAAGANAKIRDAFQHEARILLKLNHPNVLRAHDAGLIDGYFYMALTLVEGQTVEELLTHTKKLGETPAIDIAIQMTSALAYLHELGIVHRDIKPANILLNTRKRAILFDFGAAIDLRVEQPVPGEVYGTPAFLAPEQARGDAQIDGRADLYALGVTLYRMVAGRKPFYGSRGEVLEAHLLTPPPPPSDFAYVSPALEAVILKAMAKEPDARFQNAADMAAALEAARLAPATPQPELPKRILDWLRNAISPGE